MKLAMDKRMATDPAVSERQRRAMFAAAEGHSNLGIPQNVGKEFVGKDARTSAAGVIFLTPEGRALFLKRGAGSDHPGEWCWPGGGVEDGEVHEDTAAREAEEETGRRPSKLGLIDRATSDEGVDFATFVNAVAEPFLPKLDGEHIAYAWAPFDQPPEPAHPGLSAFLARLAQAEHAQDDEHGKLNEKEKAEAERNHGEREEMPAGVFLEPGERKYPVKTKQDGAWVYSRDLLLAAAREARMHGHEELAKRADAIREREFGGASDSIALDRASVRRIDQDGHLHVERTPISKANVCPYLGREIPKFEELGLDPERTYQLYRHPDELTRGAASFSGKPVMMVHKPVSAAEHPRELTVGSVGDDVAFEAPYLMAPLHVHDGEAIGLIQSDQQKQLSSAYRYRADMTPGQTPQGEPYDGVMRDIVANHVAIVKEGRAGPDVVVGDSKETLTMSKIVLTRKAALLQGALTAYLMPKLATDAKIDIGPLLVGVTSKNFATKRPGISAGLTKLTAGKLAADAKLDGLDKFLLAFDAVEPKEEDKANDAEPDPRERLHAFLKGKGFSEDDIKSCDDMLGEQEAMDAEGETEEERKAREEREKEARDAEIKEATKDMVDKKAMDAAINAAVTTAVTGERTRQQAMREAEDAVRPYIGKVAMAHDSAEAIYRTALTTLGSAADELKDLPLPALKILLKNVPVPGSAPRSTVVAQDAAGAASFHELFPEAKANPVRTI